MHYGELKKAIRMIGSQQKLASELGVARSAINHWLNRGTGISLENALHIETLTNGSIKAESLMPSATMKILGFKRYLQTTWS
jgi:DNA-binding transcriptional regulator YdaS (Cro superfamily)